MKSLYRIPIILICLSLALVGCSTSPESMPPILNDIPRQNINSILRLSEPKGWKNFESTGQVNLELENLSSEPIFFPNNYNAQVYLYKNNEWIEINNLMSYVGEAGLVYPISSSALNAQLVSYEPDLSAYDLPITLRFVVKGQIYKDNQPTGDFAGAYVDIKLNK